MTREQLEASHLIGKGNERLCYVHPEDPSKVIKIAYRKYRDQNEIDAIYHEYLEKKGVDLTHINRCYGWIEIDDTRGLVFERVVNHDGSTPKTIKNMILDGDFAQADVVPYLNELQQYLEDTKIIFADVSESNILCCKNEHGDYRLVIIDGLGSRHLGLKFWLQCHCPPYIHYKLWKQWTKLLYRVDVCFQRRADAVASSGRQEGA
ncbi:MAG: hypothetical protein HN341_07615 [Verrucomicrobia bacterium]|jgi:hypothetical protein|nr:hypothetical protein [Verrucomicrobiota bacterium]